MSTTEREEAAGRLKDRFDALVDEHGLGEEMVEAAVEIAMRFAEALASSAVTQERAACEQICINEAAAANTEWRSDLCYGIAYLIDYRPASSPRYASALEAIR